MKKLLFAIILLIWTSVLCAQEQLNETSPARPAEGKCMVYLTRQSSGAPIIKFKLYDGETLLGKLGANKYITYECEPGEHIFYARSENASYVEAHLEAGHTYVINAEPKMGFGRARVSLKPLDKAAATYEKDKEKFQEFIRKHEGVSLQNNNEEQAEKEEGAPDKYMAKFREMKADGKDITVLNPDMYLEE